MVQDPTFGVRLLNLPSRIQTVSLTMTTTGAVMMTLAWLMLGRFALGERRMTRSQLDRTLMLWVLPLLIAPPMYSRDVYSYLAQSEIALQRASTLPGRPRDRAGPRPRVHAVGAEHVARDTGALRPAVLVDRSGDFGAHRRQHRRPRCCAIGWWCCSASG